MTGSRTGTAVVEAPAAGPVSLPPHGDWLRLARRAKALSWLSLGYMAIEGAVAITAGIAAASPALIGFGIDSAIEGLASLVIVWRFTGARLLSEQAERRAQVLVAIQFFLLASTSATRRSPACSAASDRTQAGSESAWPPRAWS